MNNSIKERVSLITESHVYSLIDITTMRLLQILSQPTYLYFFYSFLIQNIHHSNLVFFPSILLTPSKRLTTFRYNGTQHHLL